VGRCCVWPSSRKRSIFFFFSGGGTPPRTKTGSVMCLRLCVIFVTVIYCWFLHIMPPQ
jgi:hypothetical protein